MFYQSVVHISIYIYPSTNLWIYLSVYLSIYVCLSVCLSPSVSPRVLISQFISVCMCVCVFTYIYIYIYLSVCPYVIPSVCQSVCLSNGLSVILSVYSYASFSDPFYLPTAETKWQNTLNANRPTDRHTTHTDTRTVCREVSPTDPEGRQLVRQRGGWSKRRRESLCPHHLLLEPVARGVPCHVPGLPPLGVWLR